MNNKKAESTVKSEKIFAVIPKGLKEEVKDILFEAHPSMPRNLKNFTNNL